MLQDLINTFKTYPYQIGTQRKRSCKTNFNKISIYFLFGVVYKDHPSSPTWTLDFCVFSAVFLPLAPTILFSHSSEVSHLKPISNPYMDHIWVKDHPRCFNWACAISNPYQIHIWAIYGSPPFPNLDFGLLSPRFLRGFPSP